MSKNVVTFKSGSKVTQGLRNRHVSISHLWLPVTVP